MNLDLETFLALLPGAFTVLWASIFAVVSGVAITRALWRRRLRLRPAARTWSRTPRVLMVRPCAGQEPHLLRALLSTAEVHHTVDLELCLTTSSDHDPARPVVLEALADLRGRGLEVQAQVIPPRGPNLKVSQLCGVADDTDADIVLVVDSDVDLAGLDLDRLVARLGTEGIAAVWCPPVERSTPATWGDRISAAVLGGSLHAFPLLGTLDPAGLVGKTFAVRTDALRKVGGFSALVRHLGEDMELARRLRAEGMDIEMFPRPVSSLATGRSARAVLARYARWLMVIRAQRPMLLPSYPLLLAAAPLVALGALTLGLATGSALAWLALAIVVTARLLLAAVGRWLCRRSLGFRQIPADLLAVLQDAVLADGLLLAAFVRALGPPRVHWRQRTLRIGRLGLLEPT